MKDTFLGALQALACFLVIAVGPAILILSIHLEQDTAQYRHMNSRAISKEIIKKFGILWLWTLAVLMLICAAQNRYPYSFYTLLRWLCCAVFAYSAVVFFRSQRTPWVWLFGGLAVLYNPIAPLWLARDTWIALNWLTVGVIVAAAGVFWFSRGDGGSARARTGKLQWIIHYGLPIILGAAIIIEVLIYFSSPEQSARRWRRTDRAFRLPSLHYSY